VASSGVVFMPVPDPSLADLVAAGWGEDEAEELRLLDAAAPVKRAVVNAICKRVMGSLALPTAAAKAQVADAFAGVGVDVAAKAAPTGYQLRRWAVAVLGDAAALPF
jgi:hypothetical protein